MTQESHNIEYKSSWRDEYLKWICGFANAQGGKLYIGKDDKGKIIGVSDAKRLMEDIPNKITNVLGIVVDVNLLETPEGDCIEINVSPQSNPVNYKGEYHYRNGSTKQELKGAALDKFLLGKQGKHWDSILYPNVSVTELKSDTFNFFRKRGLKLTENGQLKRAALLLFHPDPEKYVTNAYVKIGYFSDDDSDLLFQDEVHGNLFEQVEKTMDLLFTKYIKAIISYEGIYRVETYEYPPEAVREAIHNAIAHKDYSGATPIQISVYKNKIMIWNYGQLPENWTIDTLQEKHSSVPYNPDISNAFFRIGYIEAWGRGIRKMNEQCAKAGLPNPLYYYASSGFWVVFHKDIYNETDLREKGLNERQIKAILYLKERGKITNSEYQELNNISKRTTSNDLTDLVEKYNLLRQLGASVSTYYELK